jgi:predicted outer membrane repeat protein
VTSDLDTGAGTLRDIITNQAKAGDTIQFAAKMTGPTGQTIQLNSEIPITVGLTIDGTTSGVTIDGQNKTRIFDITSGNGLTETINNLTLKNGSAPGNNEPNPGLGGAIYDQGSLSLTGDTFSNNNASEEGGAVYNIGSGNAITLTVTNSKFNTNTAGSNGGAIATDGTSGNNVSLSGVAFTSNTAGTSGGAVYALGSSGRSLQVTNQSQFINNKTTNTTGILGSGGAIYTTDSLTVTQDTFDGNQASALNGGAIEYDASGTSSMTLTNDTFANNVAESGGAVGSNASNKAGKITETIVGCLFNNNQATISPPPGVSNYGGGFYVTATTSGSASLAVNITNSTFYKNNSSAHGGGIAILMNNTGTGSDNAILTSLTVYQNTATTDGGGLWTDPFGKNPVIVQLNNSIVAGNTIQNTPDKGPDVFNAGLLGQLKSIGYNFIGITAAGDGTKWIPLDYKGTPDNPLVPGLDPNGLAQNGGPTETIKLLPIEGGGYRMGDPRLLKAANPLNQDQRGLTRKTFVSIGAYDPDAS